MPLHSFTLFQFYSGGGGVEKLVCFHFKTESRCLLNYIFIGHIKLMLFSKWSDTQT